MYPVPPITNQILKSEIQMYVSQLPISDICIIGSTPVYAETCEFWPLLHKPHPLRPISDHT